MIEELIQKIGACFQMHNGILISPIVWGSILPFSLISLPPGKVNTETSKTLSLSSFLIMQSKES